MRQHDRLDSRIWIALVLVVQAFVAMSCTTIRYRTIQDDFNRAVEIDNRNTFERFGADQVFVDPGFDLIVDELSPGYIAQLDPRLRPNAWMIRSVCQWRMAQSATTYADGAGALDGALQSTSAGLNEPTLRDGSRDKVLLTLMPALVVDTEIQLRHGDLGNPVTEQQYRTDPDFENLFVQCVTFLDDAELAIGAPTPEDVEYYVAFQRWRILQNWRIMVSRLEAESPDEMNALMDSAAESAEQTLGGATIREAAEAAARMIPTNHPLRKRIGVE